MSWRGGGGREREAEGEAESAAMDRRGKKKKDALSTKHLQTLGEETEEQERGGPLVGVAQRERSRGLKRKALGRPEKKAAAEAARDAGGEVDDEEEDAGVDEKTSRKILEQARKQQQEQEREERGGDKSDSRVGIGLGGAGSLVTKAMERERVEREMLDEGDRSDDDDGGIEEDVHEYDEDDENDGVHFFEGGGGDGGAGARDDAYAHDHGAASVTEEDERALSAFFTSTPGQHRSLADIILEKLNKHTADDSIAPALVSGGRSGANDDGDAQALEDMMLPGVSPKVAEVYSSVADLLSRYKSGKLPKAVKIIPKLKNWEEILFLTQPHRWTPGATYMATRMFASNLNAKMAQRYNSLVLLPRVRDDILDNKRLHFNLYQALKKAVFKPAAFFKGILLPLCQSGNCTLREAVIVSSVLNRVSVPVLHSSAALMRIADMEYSGINSFFIKVLLDKKYALPYKVVDALVEHFVRFTSDERELPVVWHQSLLTFVQRYKFDVRAGDKTKLLMLLRQQHHYLVSPEVRRELLNSSSRGEIRNVPAGVAMAGGDGGAGDRDGVDGKKRRVAFEEDARDMPEVLMMEED